MNEEVKVAEASPIMKEYLNEKLLKFDVVNLNNRMYTLNSFQSFPAVLKVYESKDTYNYDQETPVGEASNFRIEDNILIADIRLYSDYPMEGKCFSSNCIADLTDLDESNQEIVFNSAKDHAHKIINANLSEVVILLKNVSSYQGILW